jgi:hypothetical protein
MLLGGGDMKTLHIVTVGISILSNLAGVKNNGFEVFGRLIEDFPWESFQENILPRADECDSSVQAKLGILNGKDETLYSPWKNSGVVCNGRGKTKGIHRLSAELTSLYNYLSESTSTITGLNTIIEKNEDEHVLFLTSDSERGKMAGAINANCIQTVGNITTVGSAADLNISESKVCVCPIPMLNTNTDANGNADNEIYTTIGTIVQKIAGNGNFSKYVFHLSGGYKFSIPYFFSMAEWVIMKLLLGSEENRPCVELVFSHEEDDHRVRYVSLPNISKAYVQLLTQVLNNPTADSVWAAREIQNGQRTAYGAGLFQVFSQ